MKKSRLIPLVRVTALVHGEAEFEPRSTFSNCSSCEQVCCSQVVPTSAFWARGSTALPSPNVEPGEPLLWLRNGGRAGNFLLHFPPLPQECWRATLQWLWHFVSLDEDNLEQNPGHNWRWARKEGKWIWIVLSHCSPGVVCYHCII